jgi:hypothetical protein
VLKPESSIPLCEEERTGLQTTYDENGRAPSFAGHSAIRIERGGILVGSMSWKHLKRDFHVIEIDSVTHNHEVRCGFFPSKPH